jgi:MYXO-CTERM domain-containing protein
MRNRAHAASAFVLTSALAGVASADFSDWSDDRAGATRIYSNRAGRIPWENHLGDWSDAEGTPQGEVPFAEHVIAREATRVEIDVTALVQRWASGELRADGFFIRPGESGTATIHSREAADPAVHPALLLETAEGDLALAPEADTELSSSTVSAKGEEPDFHIGRALIRFPRAEIVGRTISRATLVLHRASTGGGAVRARIFACRQSRVVMPVEHGFASGYELDRGIAAHPDVYVAVDFSGDQWTAEHRLWDDREGTVIDESHEAEVANGFVPLDGPAVRWGFAAGYNGGGGAMLAFPDGEEPDELYSRYYMRLGDNFTPTVDGGKFPGFAHRPHRDPKCNGGSYDRTGTMCWSARGHFNTLPPETNPFAGFLTLGYYVYHPEQEDEYGSNWEWNLGYDGHIARGRWYAIEQYVRMNTPGEHDGILRAWVNGRLVMEKTDILFRNSDALHVGEVWYNIFHGGTAEAPHDMYLWVDNLVVARSYIGPSGGLPDVPPLLEDGTIAPPRDGGAVPLDGALSSVDAGVGARPRGDGATAETEDPRTVGAACSCRAAGAPRSSVPGGAALALGLLASLALRRRHGIVERTARAGARITRGMSR